MVLRGQLRMRGVAPPPPPATAAASGRVVVFQEEWRGGANGGDRGSSGGSSRGQRGRESRTEAGESEAHDDDFIEGWAVAIVTLWTSVVFR